MNRFDLPDINFLEKSPEDIERDLLMHIEDKTGFTLSNADPRRKFVQWAVALVTQERNYNDYALKQNLLSYAEGEMLDHQGESFATFRLDDKASNTTMEFILEPDRVDVLPIANGTLFLVGEDTYFETQETIIVPVGQNTVQMDALCTEAGEKGNGYLPGEISSLVQPLPWVKSVRNITVSSGGIEVEDDNSYAHRIRLAPESFSVAGPEGAYEYWVKSVSQQIVDVKAQSPVEGHVDIRILLRNGELPTQEILDKALELLNHKQIRPLTDKVSVGAPEQIEYDTDVQYWIVNSKASMQSAIQKQVEDAFQTYIKWQKEKMGRDIDQSELIALLKAAGAYRVIVNSQMYKQVGEYQVAKDNVTRLVFGGLTNE